MNGTKIIIRSQKLQYSRRLLGWWGQGACERLQSLQGVHNRLNILDQKSRWMQASFIILVENSSKVVSQHLNNEVGTIIRYTNTPPQYITPPAIDNSNAQRMERIKQDAYEQEGVSQLAASNLKPIGINSGTALRTVNQINEDRQLFFGQRVENFALEIARQAIEVAKDIYKEKGTYKVTYPNTHFMETIDWKDINLTGDEYWLKAFPTSSLPEEPAAKLETVTEYMQAGIISPRAGRRLLRKPDIEMADMLADAAEDLICKSIESIIYDGENVRPDSEWDLGLAKDYALKYMNFAKLHGCPAANLRKLRKFMKYIDDENGVIAQGIAGQQALAAQQQQAQQASAPTANPMPTPTSPMVPNGANVKAAAWSWRNVSKIKNSKWDIPCFVTYVLRFPDGDQWVKQTPFTAKSLDLYLKNMIAEHSRDRKGRGSEWRDRAMALWKGRRMLEWKDNLKVEHLMIIEVKKRPSSQLRWGVSKKGIGTVNRTDETGHKRIIIE